MNATTRKMLDKASEIGGIWIEAVDKAAEFSGIDLDVHVQRWKRKIREIQREMQDLEMDP